MSTTTKPRGRKKSRGSTWQDYLPLMVMVGVTMLAAGARQWSEGDLEGNWMSWMHDFMGLFLMVFAMIKMFDLPGFADGFQMYDLLAMRVRAYAYAYPFIELALGLGYLARWQLMVVYTATIVLLLWGATGVVMALRKGLDVNCACMGTILKVPLSTVALIEDGGMAAMAGVMLLMLLTGG